MKKLKIVAIDDTMFVLETLRAWLEGMYEIHTFTSGKDGLHYLSENHTDLILLDYDMPGMTGYEVLMNIRVSKIIGNVPVLFLTGITNPRMEEEMLERGATGYIKKPLDLTVLLSNIEKHIHHGK